MGANIEWGHPQYLQGGFFTAKRSENSGSRKSGGDEKQGVEFKKGRIEVTLNPDSPLTYKDFSAQLSQLNITFISEEKLTAPDQDGDGVVDEEELVSLDQQIEAAASNNRDFVLRAVQQDGSMLNYANDNFRNDKEIVLAAIKARPVSAVFDVASERLKKDKAFVLEVVRDDGLQLHYADAALRSDREVVSAAVSDCGRALQYAGDALKDDEQIVLAAVGQNSEAFQYAGAGLRKDKKFVLEVMQKCSGYVFEHADDALKSDRQFMLELVKSDFGYIVEYADDPLKSDRDFILAAVKISGDALGYADVSLQSDYAVVLAAVIQDGLALQYASDELREDKGILTMALAESGFALMHAGPLAKKAADIVLAAVKKHGASMQFADVSLKKDPEFVLKAAAYSPLSFDYADESLKRDPETVLAAVKRRGQTFEYADKSLKSDKAFVLDAVYYDAYAFQFADGSLRNDPEFCIDALWKNWHVYRFIPENIRAEVLEGSGHFGSNILLGLGKLNIEFVERFKNYTDFKEVVLNRINLKGADSRPLAVIIYPKTDHNRAFEPNNIGELIEKGYRVVYFEVASDEAVYQAVEAATVKQKAQLIILGGHGIAERTAMGATDPASSEMSDEVYYIDLSDKPEMKQRHLSLHLEKGAVILLESCSTGRGKQDGNNVANLMREVFPQASVYAPTLPTGVSKLTYDENGRVSGARFIRSDEDVTYSAKESPL